MPTIQQRVAAAREQLRAAGLSPAEAEVGARVIAEHVLGWSRERLIQDGPAAEPDGFHDRFDRAIARRADREPLAYILGEREFWGLRFEVSPDVLIPRPETEIIVETALDLHPDRHGPLAVADICTGSGCVAVALAHERPAWAIVAADISDAALAIARRNVTRHAVASRVRVMRADVLEGLAGSFDLITANPPYVRSGDRPGLQPEVREEPDVALFGGTDGLDLIRRVVQQAVARLKTNGYLLCEFGLGQEIEVEHIVATSGLTLVGLRRDLQGIARTAVVRRD